MPQSSFASNTLNQQMYSVEEEEDFENACNVLATHEKQPKLNNSRMLNLLASEEVQDDNEEHVSSQPSRKNTNNSIYQPSSHPTKADNKNDKQGEKQPIGGAQKILKYNNY